MTLFLGLTIVVWGFFFLFWIISAFQNRQDTQRTESLPSRAVNIILYGVAAALLLFEWKCVAALSARVAPDGYGIPLTGWVLQTAGLGFALWARKHLGKNWNAQVALAKDHHLIQSGPYQVVRHPMYLGILAGMFGTAIVIGQVRGLLAAVAVLIALIWKIRGEEEILRGHFGERYHQYSKEVKSIIPFLF